MEKSDVPDNNVVAKDRFTLLYSIQVISTHILARNGPQHAPTVNILFWQKLFFEDLMGCALFVKKIILHYNSLTLCLEVQMQYRKIHLINLKKLQIYLL